MRTPWIAPRTAPDPRSGRPPGQNRRKRRVLAGVQLNLYLTNDDDTRRTGKAAAMLVDRSAAGREIIEAVVTVMEHLVSGAEGNARINPAQTIRPETLRALAGDQALADVVNRLAAMPNKQRANTLALLAKVVRHDLHASAGLRSRLRLAWRLIRGA